MRLNPDWSSEESYSSLKTVLKWEIQNLLQRLAEAGEEAFLFTVCVKDGGTTEMGSPRGQVFLSMSDLQNVKSQFQSYCQGVTDICDQVEIYRDLSSGRLSLGPKSSIDTENTRKRRKKTYLQQAKVPRLSDEEQRISVKQELSSTSDENSGGNSSTFEQGTRELDRLESTAENDSSVKLSLPMLTMRSRRKRTPKKCVTNDTGEDDNDMTLDSENFDHTKEGHLDNQSENLDMTGSLFEKFFVKKSQSMDQISENQSENLELTSHSEDFSQDFYNKEVDFETPNEKPSSYQRSFEQTLTENNALSVLLQKTKGMVSKRAKNSARKSMNMNSTVSSIADSKLLFKSEKSIPVFPNSSGNEASLYSNAVGVSNSVGGAGDIGLPMATLEEDGNMRIVIGESEIGGDNSFLTNERSLLLGQLSTSAESPKIEKQADYSSGRKRGFKPVPHDESSAETALLDASKLCIGRYKCPMCGQTTRDRHDLKRHLRTHTKEKPYRCWLCFRKFTRKWDLDNHVSRHNKSDRDEANAKLGKQFNKAIENTNTEVLTYEKLVAKLIQEKNITVGSSTDANATLADEERAVEEDVDNLINSKHALENEHETGAECRKSSPLYKESPGKGTVIKSKRKRSKGKGASSFHEDYLENSELDLDEIEGINHSIEGNVDSGHVTSETLLDNLNTKFMNDTFSVKTEVGSGDNDEYGNASDINAEAEIDIKTELIETDEFTKFESKGSFS